jgi:hypothetical protein
LVAAALVSVASGVTAGVIATGAPQTVRTGEDPASESSSSAVRQPTASAAPTTNTAPTSDAGVALPTSDPLTAQQFIVPRGNDAATQLTLANVAGVIGPRMLADADGRNSWPMLSADRRTIIYINYVAGTVWVMAADGSGDRRLIASPTAAGRLSGRPGARRISRSWSSSVTDRKAGSDADPSWSPDGTMIAFRRRGSTDNFNVYVMRSDGSDVRPIATGPAVEEKPAWSSDASQIMIISNRAESGKSGETYDVWVFDVNGGRPRPLGLSANVVLTPVWSYR